MKKILPLLIMTLFLTGCSTASEPQIQYIEKEVVVEKIVEVPVEVVVEKEIIVEVEKEVIVEVEKEVVVVIQCKHPDMEKIYWNNLCIKKCKSCGHSIITQPIILEVSNYDCIYTKTNNSERWEFIFNCKVLQCVGKFSFPCTLINGKESMTYSVNLSENHSTALHFRFFTKPRVGDKLSIEGYDTHGNTIEWFYILTNEDVDSL